MISAVILSVVVNAQVHLETTIKKAGNGKARIAVKAVGTGDLTGSPDNFIFTVAIPKENGDAGADLLAPTKLDAARVPASLDPISSYTDGTYKYFNVFYSGAVAGVTFVNGTEYEILELNWAGAAQHCQVSLISMADGNPLAPVVPQQWLVYLSLGGSQFSFGDVLFYQSGSSLVPTQMAADYTSGTASITTTDLISLPVTILNFSGYKNGTKNVLRWTTASESNCLGFQVQRSIDGVNYSSIGFVNSKASGGNSSSNITYTFDDNSPVGKKQYYRLLQQDMDGGSKLSNTVVISGGKPTTLAIGGLFPNPAKTQVSVIIDAPERDNVTLMILDINGKTLKQQIVNVEIGSNTVPVDISSLAQGSYLIKAVCKSSDCGMAVGKFNKQL